MNTKPKYSHRDNYSHLTSSIIPLTFLCWQNTMSFKCLILSRRSTASLCSTLDLKMTSDHLFSQINSALWCLYYASAKTKLFFLSHKNIFLTLKISCRQNNLQSRCTYNLLLQFITRSAHKKKLEFKIQLRKLHPLIRTV